jgi:hypothetical protein
VGGEVVALPELTAAVKARLAELGPDAKPTRRQIIALSKSTLKGMIVRSLVFQEARDRPGGPEALRAWTERFTRKWDEIERPELARQLGVVDDAGLRARLARTLATPESLRDEFVVRSIAAELIRRDRPGLAFETYLDEIRVRRPVESIMGQAELMAAGRRAARGEGRGGSDGDDESLVDLR